MSNKEQQLIGDFQNSLKKMKEFSLNNPHTVNFEIVQPSLSKLIKYSLNDPKKSNDIFLQTVINIIDSQTVFRLFYDKLIIELKTASNDKLLKQNIAYLLLKNTLERKKFNLPLVSFFENFYGEKFYSNNSKSILKKFILNMNSRTYGKFLFFIDAANLYEDKDIYKYLEKYATKCTQWSETDREWFALLLFAKYKDENIIRKLITIANVLPESSRASYVFFMPVHLSFVQSPLVVKYLTSCLKRKDQYRSSGDLGYLRNYSARALNAMLIGFPKINVFSSNLDQINKCLKWINTYSDYEFRNFNDYPLEIKMWLWR